MKSSAQYGIFAVHDVLDFLHEDHSHLQLVQVVEDALAHLNDVMSARKALHAHCIEHGVQDRLHREGRGRLEGQEGHGVGCRRWLAGHVELEDSRFPATAQPRDQAA